MTQLEVDQFDAPEKAWKSKESSEPGEASPDLRAALLGDETAQEDEQEESSDSEPETSEAQKKADEEGQKVVDNYSEKIQQASEELYETLASKAKHDESFLDELIQGDATDRKFAQKILKRNAKHFGAETIEKYQKKQSIESAGDDPTAKELATLKAEINELKESKQTESWQSFKDKNKVGGDLAVFADEVRTEYPDISYGDAVALARSRMGIPETRSQKQSSSVAGGASPGETEDITSSPLAKTLLPNLKETKKFAKEFLV